MNILDLVNTFQTTKFERVSYEQFKQDWLKTFSDYDESDDEDIRQIYDEIELPTRSSSGSAGYDFKCPIWLTFKPKESIMIPTGIRCIMPSDMVLMMYPRSGLGSKNRFIPRNLTGIVDSDYCESDNEGHIFMFMANDGDERLVIEKGKAFCQGILMRYFITDDDLANGKRNGGFGSSNA